MALFRKRAESDSKRLDQILEHAEVPQFPSSALEVLKRLRRPNVEFDEVSEALQWDPILMTRVLKLVNSAAYAPRSPILDVRHAVSYLGHAAIEQIVTAVAVRTCLPGGPAPGFEPRRFWETASRRAALARALCDELQPLRQAECFTAGLLSDLAVPVLAHARPSDYGPVLQAWHGEAQTSLDRLEREELGWDHAEVGAALGRAWELPEALVGVIENHHREEASDAEVPGAIRLVGVLRETQEEVGIEALVETAKADYGLEADWVIGVVEAVEEQARSLSALLA